MKQSWRHFFIRPRATLIWRRSSNCTMGFIAYLPVLHMKVSSVRAHLVHTNGLGHTIYKRNSTRWDCFNIGRTKKAIFGNFGFNPGCRFEPRGEPRTHRFQSCAHLVIAQLNWFVFLIWSICWHVVTSTDKYKRPTDFNHVHSLWYSNLPPDRCIELTI